ncbi:hypothetical protein CBS101457_002003 [Exobasidium rhododendri]|nr:hypothetical protein CBS101457_002003 [Exobasidium rhododendri]
MSASLSSPSTSVITMESIDDSFISTTATEENDDAQSENDDLDAPPLLQPDPMQIVSCLRAPCLKRQAAAEAKSRSSLNILESASPSVGKTSPDEANSYIFTGIKAFFPAIPKRSVHFEVAPPEAGLTHSGDHYDRRPIECTQGGSQLDLRLPPRGTCPRYADDADDEACEDEDEDEESKQERLRGFARWARLKNGGSMLGGATGVKFDGTSGRRNSQEAPEGVTVCSVPVHGIRSFGGLAGKSCLTPSVDVTNTGDEEDSIESRNSDSVDSNSMATLENHDQVDDSEPDDENDSFRKAVYATLSKDPNATPMPSPKIRPRWESLTSYFDTEKESSSPKECDSLQSVAEQPARKASEIGDMELTSSSTLCSSLTTEQEDSRVATWTENQAVSIIEEKLPLAPVLAFTLASPSAKSSNLVSPEDNGDFNGTATTTSTPSHNFSSPMSSRCSSFDAWSSGGIGETWNRSEQEAIDAAFSKHATVPSSSAIDETATPKLVPSALADLNAEEGKNLSHRRSSPDTQTLEEADRLHHQELDHEQATSSSSSGGGPGWMSSCCTSPEVEAIDLSHTMTVDGALVTGVLLNDHSVKGAYLQRLVPLDLQINEKDNRVEKLFLEPSTRYANLLDRRGIRETVSSPTSGETSPQILSADEEDTCHKVSDFFRCSSKKNRKTRRAASSPDEFNRPNLTPRSKSMSSTSSLSPRRVPLVKKTSAFNSELDDEGALGGF